MNIFRWENRNETRVNFASLSMIYRLKVYIAITKVLLLSLVRPRNHQITCSLATSTPSSQSFAPQPRTRERFFLSPHRPTKPRRKLCSPSSCSSLSVFSSTFGFSSEGRRGFSRGRQTAFADLSSSSSRTGCLTCRPEVWACGSCSIWSRSSVCLFD